VIASGCYLLAAVGVQQRKDVSSGERGGSHLPYASIDDLPPLQAQEIYLPAFNSAWTEYQPRSADQLEQTAHRVVWGR
jgi:cation transport regulator